MYKFSINYKVAILLHIFILNTQIDNVVYGAPPPDIQINKCCRLGESINDKKQCELVATENWVPTVYLIKRNVYFSPKGSAPRFLQIRENTLPPACSNPQLFTGADAVAIFSNGTLFVSEIAHKVNSTDEYCVDKDAALVCLAPLHGADLLTSLMKLSKVKKCCGQNAAYNQDSGNCIPIKDNHPVFNKSILNSTSVEITYGFPHCNVESQSYKIFGKFFLDTFNETTGSIEIIFDTDNNHIAKTLQWDEYCLEHTLNDLDSYINIFSCDDTVGIESIEVTTTYQDIRSTLFAVSLLISVVFLIATLATGFLLPSNHHLLHWRCQTYYVFCLLAGDLLLAPIQYFGKFGSMCVVMAICMHFFFLAAFFWLNTMCFNIWWTFRDFRPTSLEKGQEVVRLRIYRIYAWGLPTLIAGIAAILDNIPKGPDEGFLRPRFGESKCWFYGDMEIFIYFFGPIGILLIINVLLFASTARQLTCGLWKRDDVKSTTERAALGKVCLKLVVVMGVTWVADVVSWAVGGPYYIWYFTDLINALHGVFIFIVVGCQPQVWTAAKRLWSSKTGRGITNTTNGPQHSSSSHGLPSIGESVTNNTFTNTTSTKVPMETIC